MDYKELIKSLRGCTGDKCSVCYYKTEAVCIDMLMEDAADAIEKLQAVKEEYKGAYIMEHDARIEEIKRHKRISMKSEVVD